MQDRAKDPEDEGAYAPRYFAYARLELRKHRGGCVCRPCERDKRVALDGGLWRALASLYGESATAIPTAKPPTTTPATPANASDNNE